MLRVYFTLNLKTLQMTHFKSAFIFKLQVKICNTLRNNLERLNQHYFFLNKKQNLKIRVYQEWKRELFSEALCVCTHSWL